MHEVVVVGGAGDMARVAVTKLLLLRDDCRVTLADRDVPGAELLASELGDGDISVTRVDIFDATALREAVSGARLVMNCTGPYYRTGRPVLEACIDGGVDYVDMCDDEDSALSLLELDDKASKKDVTALICCGIAPGLVNVLARMGADMLDEFSDIDLAWVSGQTPPSEDRAAGSVGVIEHMLHCCVGECATVRDGKRTMIPAFKSGHMIGFPPPLGDFMVFELGHAEPATIPRFMPGLNNLRTMGAIHPPYLNGLFRGVAAQVTRGTVSMKKAVDFIVALDTNGKVPAWRPFLGVLDGTAGQLVRGEITIGDIGGLIQASRGRLKAESLGGIYVSVTGVKDGKPARVTFSQSSVQGEGEGSMDIDVVTGTCLAAFASLMLSGEVTARGVVAPEACVDPPRYLEELNRALPEFDMDLEPHLAWLD
ncbi:MAG: saccharopine dehydrogenase NADP-binding domain-containing protein [Actinobacteria bacterium]|nr:saccharopine dehydrogenase NADP-binding domain-containing protein [Actinomycetota bacterium]MBU1943192.1 saccharopine dehydrogenase NADP-binding domain-containing protein [Actinomycetota bacterium]MBU2687870.1 saccharopine dehydrogenase NADP-binding domain-containing protein [Actinomycetota bacterium]